jgi:hypothetical protein
MRSLGSGSVLVRNAGQDHNKLVAGMASSDYSSGFMHNTGHVLFSNEVYSIG